MGMKALDRKFKSILPKGLRSKVAAEFSAAPLKAAETSLERAAKKANRFMEVRKDAKDWEALNETADRAFAQLT